MKEEWMESIQSFIGTTLANASPVVRVGLMVIGTAIAFMLATNVGMSLGKALYYLTH